MCRKSKRIISFSIILVCVLLISLFLGCNKNHNYVHEFSLGDGLPTVRLDADYYRVTLPYSLKDDDATDFYKTDSNLPHIVVYRFKWATEDGNWSTMEEYFEHEASKFETTTHKAAWEEAGFPECRSYVKTESFMGELYITTCYAIQDGQDCVEVFYLDKIAEVPINDANVKFIVPNVNESVEIEEHDLELGMVDNRISNNAFFPSIGFYCNQLSKAPGCDIYSDAFIDWLITYEQDTNFVKTTINGYKTLTGSRVDKNYGPVNFVMYEVNNHIVSAYYTATNDEMIANGINMAQTIQPLS